MKKRHRKTSEKQKQSIRRLFTRKSLRHSAVPGKQVFLKNCLNELIENDNVSSFDLYNILQHAYCNSESYSTSYSNDLRQEQNNNIFAKLSDTNIEVRNSRNTYKSTSWNNVCQQKETIILKPSRSYHSEANNKLNTQNDLINYKCFEDHLNEISLSSECDRACCLQKYHRFYSKHNSFYKPND